MVFSNVLKVLMATDIWLSRIVTFSVLLCVFLSFICCRVEVTRILFQVFKYNAAHNIKNAETISRIYPLLLKVSFYTSYSPLKQMVSNNKIFY